MSASTEDGQGPSTFRFELPDVCVTTFVGDVSAATVRAIAAEQQRAVKGLPFILVIADVSRVRSVSAEARRAAMDEQPGVIVQGVSYVGASFPIRVIATLLNKAAALLYKGKATSYPVQFFDTLDEARAWCAKRRRDITP
jgi:hypothetical protein